MTRPPDRLTTALESRYRIERQLGEGGMATVYLAEDLKHKRQVAIKVLRPELAAMVGAQRFLAEIETTANLQHPHILPLYDSGEAGSFLFYVMPYVEGESLRDRLDRERQLGVGEALDITRKIGGALDYAHGRGIVHRDIKPANVLLSEQGEPLVADFGIALAVAQAGAGRITETGLSLGTPHYMSPEQATGDRTVDPRSDVYSLGCLLYEMLAGDPPHTGPNAQAVLVRILTEEPQPVTDVRRSVPPHVGAAISKAMEKLPADRFESATALADALDDESFAHVRPARDAASAGSVGPVSSPTRPYRRAVVALSLVTTAAAVLAAWGWLRPAADAGSPATRSVLDLGELRMPTTTERVQVSPDGARFAVVAADPDGQRALFVRNADEDGFRMIDGTEGAFDPDFSPDGEWLVYETVEGTLARVPVGGGASRPVVPAGFVPNTPLWAEDGTIFFLGRDGVYGVPETGGQPELLLETAAPLYPTVLLPGGRRLLATDRGNGTTVLVDLETDSVEVLLSDGVDARYLDSGHLLYADLTGGLWAAPFDAARGELQGEPTLLFDGLDVVSEYYARYSVSDNGTLVYRTGGEGGPDQRLAVVGLDGTVEELPLTPREILHPRWSPDGRTLVYASGGSSRWNLFAYDVDVRTTPRQLTFEGVNYGPSWSPDGRHVVFASIRGTEARPRLFVKNVTDDSAPSLLATLDGSPFPTQWPFADLIVFENDDDLWTLDPSADSAVGARYLTSEFNLEEVQVSPRGDLAAYTSNEMSGLALTSAGANDEVFVRSFPEPGSPVRVSHGGGRQPRWSPDGATLYYWGRPTTAEARSLVAARVQRGPPLAVTGRDTLLSMIRGTATGGDWDLHPAGDRLVVTQRAGSEERSDARSPTRSRTLIVTNWFEELKRLMRGGG